MAFLQNISGSAELYADTTTLTERTLLLLYVLVVTVLGMVGNVIVIVGSFAFRGHHNDKLSMVLFRNLAMADFLCVVLQVIPTLVVHVRQGWVWGEKMCLFIGAVRYYPAMAQMAMVFLMTLYRWLRCCKPIFTQNNLSKRRAVVTVTIVWLVYLIVPIWFSVNNYEVHYRNDICRINTFFSDANLGMKIVPIIGNIVGFLLPYMLIIGITIRLGIFAKKIARNSVLHKNKKILIVTITVAGVLLVAWAPFIVVFFVGVFVDVTDNAVKRLTQYFAMLSFCSNPIIYTC